MRKKINVLILVLLLCMTCVNIKLTSLKADETDTYPPEIISISANPETVGFGFNVTINVNVIDNLSGVNLVKVNITFPDNTYCNNTMNNTEGNTYEYVFSDTWQLGQHNYTIWTVDNSNNTNLSSQYSFNISAQVSVSICTIKDEYGANELINLTDPPGNSYPLIGYELLDNDDVLHIWNKFDSYYFDTNSGIQLTNHYNEYWSHNVLMLGYYNNNQWNLVYRTDELAGFNKNIDTDNETYVNTTIWKDLTYQGYNFRLAIRYHLGVDDNELTVIPYIKNLGDTIPYDLGFGWEMKDIQIDMTTAGDYIDVNRTMYYLNQILNNTYSDLPEPEFYLIENTTDTSTKSLYLKWNQSLTYKLQVKSRDGQYNAPVTLFVRIGTLNSGQEKHTMMYWYDADQVTYYFNSYDNKEYWVNNPSYIVDGSTSNYASTSSDGQVELCNGNTCSGTDLGIISKVEIRVHGYFSGDPRDIILRPVLGGTSDGNNYNYQAASGQGIWSPWFDITAESGAPWSWSDMDNLDCDVEMGQGMLPSTVYASKVEVRVTYNPYNPPEISTPYPANGGIGMSLNSMLNITVSDTDGDLMNITWSSNSSGSWQVFGTNNSVSNGTYHQTFLNATENGKWWYWCVNVTDGRNYTTSSIYKFYTGYESVIKNTGSTNISGYLSIQLQFYCEPTDTWVVAYDAVNEDNPRTINASDQLVLDAIFNGLLNVSNISYLNGTYRVYVSLKTPDGQVLISDNDEKIEAAYGMKIARPLQGWYKLFADDGFGKASNLFTRGIGIYKDEMYIGTQNHNLSKLKIFCNGFTQGTCITMANGSYKNIEDIQIGDIVKAYDVVNDSYVDANVTMVYNYSSDFIPDYYFVINNQIHTSPEQILCVNGTLMKAKDAKVGDYLTNLSCSNVSISSKVNMSANPSVMYNFEIVEEGCEKSLLPNNLTYFADDVQAYPWLLLETPDGDFWSSLLLFILNCFGTHFCRWMEKNLCLASEGCEVWKYNSTSYGWTQVVGDLTTEGEPKSGFGDHCNCAIGDIKEFNGDLYVGTGHYEGCEVWRYDGSSWEQVVGNEDTAFIGRGFNNPDNLLAATMEVFTNESDVTHLYVGTINLNWNEPGFCQIWRTADGENWVKVVDQGFRDNDASQYVRNAYLWSMEVFQDELYAGTFNVPLPKNEQNLEHRGCQLWKSNSGNSGDWEKVDIPGDNGFGEHQNYGIRKLVKWDNSLYVGVTGSALQTDGDRACEIWKYNEMGWECIIGNGSSQSEIKWKDGFGDYLNKYPWSMVVVNDALWIGTLNHRFTVFPWTESEGCEVWRYDGTDVSASVENENGEISNGFGQWFNRGARMMIEYPEGSSQIIIGTMSIHKPLARDINEEEGCEIWIRYP